MTEFINRKITQAIENAAASFPVITITGPRQSGKTTLARHMFPEYPYFSLENPDVRNLAMEDPVGFLNNTAEGIILDKSRIPHNCCRTYKESLTTTMKSVSS